MLIATARLTDKLGEPMLAMTDDPQITICPPGKRAGLKAVLRTPADSPIPFTTQTALESPPKARMVPPARDDRRSAQERVEAAERAETLSVALNQPHRAGSDDPRMAFPLGRFCARAWKNDPSFGAKMYSAGTAYAADVRAVRIARGFHVVGSDREAGRNAGSPDDPTPEEIAIQRAAIYGAERTLEKADWLLRDIMPRCVSAMLGLCFLHDEPSPYDEGMLKNGLYRLSLHYGKYERGVGT